MALAVDNFYKTKSSLAVDNFFKSKTTLAISQVGNTLVGCLANIEDARKTIWASVPRAMYLSNI